MNIVTMQQEGDRAYWLASSEAMTTVKELKSKGVLINTAQRITTPSVNGSKGTILTEVRQTQNPKILMIYVEASIGTAVHTISFQYNKSQRDIVDWTDSDVKLK